MVDRSNSIISLRVFSFVGDKIQECGPFANLQMIKIHSSGATVNSADGEALWENTKFSTYGERKAAGKAEVVKFLKKREFKRVRSVNTDR